MSKVDWGSDKVRNLIALASVAIALASAVIAGWALYVSISTSSRQQDFEKEQAKEKRAAAAQLVVPDVVESPSGWKYTITNTGHSWVYDVRITGVGLYHGKYSGESGPPKAEGGFLLSRVGPCERVELTTMPGPYEIEWDIVILFFRDAQYNWWFRYKDSVTQVNVSDVPPIIAPMWPAEYKSESLRACGNQM